MSVHGYQNDPDGTSFLAPLSFLLSAILHPTVRQAFQPAGFGDFPAAKTTGQECPANPQTWKSALQGAVFWCGCQIALVSISSHSLNRVVMVFGAKPA